MVLLHVLAPAPAGGLERVVQSLALGLTERGHEVHVAAIVGQIEGPQHPFLQSLAGSGVKVHEIRTGNRAYLQEREAVRQLCLRVRPAVVHTHGYRPDVLASSAARKLGISTATTVHGFTGGDWRNRLYETLQRRAFRSFDAVVAVSRPLNDQLAISGLQRNLRLIQNAWPGSTTWLSSEEARRHLGIQNGACQVGWVGRLSPEKGADVLLRALPALSDPTIEVNFLGDGPARAELESLSSRNEIKNRVRWLGNRPAADTLFKAFDVFVLSSRTEGTPMVIFEAMAAGIPVIAARVGGVPDVVDETCAWLIPPDDPAALAAAIRAVRDEPGTAAARATVARQRVATRFSRADWVRRYEDLYHELQR